MALIIPLVGTPIRFAATVREDYAFEVELSEEPIESLVEVADHALVRPEKIMLECWATEHQDAFITAGANVFAQGPRAVLEQLRGLLDRRELVTLATPFLAEINMMLVRLTVPRDQKASDALRFVLELRKVEIGTVAAPDNLSPVAVDGAQPESNLGNQGTSTPQSSVRIPA